MRLENWFEVPAPPKQAWELLIDVPRVVPCMPGATLEEAAAAVEAQARPVQGLRLGLGALWRALGRLFRRG